MNGIPLEVIGFLGENVAPVQFAFPKTRNINEVRNTAVMLIDNHIKPF